MFADLVAYAALEPCQRRFDGVDRYMPLPVKADADSMRSVSRQSSRKAFSGIAASSGTVGDKDFSACFASYRSIVKRLMTVRR